VRFVPATSADSLTRVITGRATPEGTRRFAARADVAPGHFRQAMGGLSLSSIGLGTYLGREDAATDAGYEACVAAGLASGVNVFDTAINYRGQLSERAVGRALATAFSAKTASRDEVFVSTKGGYTPHDAGDPRPAGRYVKETFLDSGLAPAGEVAQGCHCMAPAYLADQIARSRENLGLDTIDLYYLHNVETQLEDVGREIFRERLARAIEVLERSVADGTIAAWGLATWNGLRVPPEHPEHLSLPLVRDLAEKVAGPSHHFRAVQLPVSLGMAHAVGYRSQVSGATRVSALDAAAALGIAAFGSASLMQGRLVADLPDAIVQAFPEGETPARRALQFARSAPGLTTALVGVSNPAHAADDFGLAKFPPAEGARVLSVFA
jgi:aryl-alcohol dehydrogenase-like predicted oxidoreductase